MRLAIDIGNTNIVVGAFKKKELIFNFRLSTDKNKTEYEYAVIFNTIFHTKNIDKNEINGAIISSVVPVLTKTIEKAVDIFCGITPLILSAGIKTGIDIRTENPNQTGADRIADSVGGLMKYNLPLLIIDIGTAVTLSIINEKRQFVGGIIAAGPRLELSALKKGTAQLTEVGLHPPDKVIGRNTHNAVSSGIIYGIASMLDSLIFKIKEEIGSQLTVVATGGMSFEIISCCKSEIIYDEFLLLNGLNHIYEINVCL